MSRRDGAYSWKTPPSCTVSEPFQTLRASSVMAKPRVSPEAVVLPALRSATGEMAQRVRDFDWASTPLGPMERWPQSLRIALGICLNSRFPMFVWWGRSRINIYNDAYIPMLGKRHPAALGRPARETWDDIWAVVGPQSEAVLERGEATWNDRVVLMMERHGYLEETYFTWSYSPIYDESGGIGGMYCAVVEETPRVMAERARDRLLRENETERARLAEAFDKSPSFLAILRGPQHVFEYVNERYKALLGRRELVGLTVREAVPEVSGQGFFEILDRVYSTGKPFVGNSVPIQLRREEQGALETRYLDFVYQPTRDPDGQVVGILAHGVDVTEREVSEARDRFLLSLEDALRTLSDSDDISASVTRLLGTYLDADRCAYAHVEDDEDTFNVLGDYSRSVGTMVGRYRFSQFGAEIAACMREGRPYVVNDIEAHDPARNEVALYRRLGIRAIAGVPLRKGGRTVAAMSLQAREPRDWTAAEIELLAHVASRCYESIERSRVQRTLRESERRFRQLADAMPQIVFVADADGNIEYFNRQWYEYTGLPEGGVSRASWERVHTRGGLERVAQAWPHALRTGEPYEIEYELRRHDGAYRWHLGRALPIRDEHGRIVRWFGTNTDIHDRKGIEQALGQALEAEQHARGQAEQASRMKDEFLATLSHELRTPLNAILGWSHLIRRPNATPEELTKAAEVIERNARSQATIIEDLLDMSAIMSGKVRLDMHRIDLASVVRAAIETAEPPARAKSVEIRAIVAPGESAVTGDANRLQQVLWNLLTNAVKFTPRGGRVDVVMRHVDGNVEVCVNDTGEGIAPDFLPFVFDRFRQADASSARRHGGLGLGLSIVKQLVELHGGEVRVESEGLGRGATFTVALPLLVPNPRGAGRESKSRARAHAGDGADHVLRGQLEGVRALVVDDERDARDLIQRLLQEAGADVATAASTEEALGQLDRDRFDVLVSDIGMPGRDGYELIQAVRTRGTNQALPALALTAYARAEDRAKVIAAGFQKHLPKPVDPARVVSLVASLVRERPSG